MNHRAQAGQFARMRTDAAACRAFARLAAAGLLCLLYACTGRGAGDKGAAAPAGATGTPAAASTQSVCDRKLLTAADVAGIVTPPIIGTKDIPGDPQSCSFETGEFAAVQVTLRPGNGRVTVDAWTSGKMQLSAAPLAGVGDHAVWVDSLNEVDAEKNDVLCSIEARTPSEHYRAAPAELQQRLGALCNKIFAANAS
jgi:hypothetical protein